eukprot:CAMPEP_0175998192 /NCGR_PEP_ID=MMETSP0108-20121206/56597_1 /TAXON_ID=195067 ORGANISM="Goniomonas pacifica, Strain CCMP1869" /NCGR_SAMPLE_ID=MMETSP0108 /ASSEMBLY_ACC=CAM_ASM_000204 /LENGTH=79 /DNA_ID=CAMNT_0017330491 /DNA_START=235 /DNA_END=474 /DNA_ORIENTATION=+
MRAYCYSLNNTVLFDDHVAANADGEECVAPFGILVRGAYDNIFFDDAETSNADAVEVTPDDHAVIKDGLSTQGNVLCST